jgi:ubiquinone/menaquinone biosynthesis C-methylase UbiE
MGSFEGVAEVYQRSRHNYPVELRDHLIDIGALEPRSIVLDLGAGTGQLAPMAGEIARSVIAVEPEPDMVRVGRNTTDHLDNIQWVTGSDQDLLRIVKPPIDLVLIGSAFHLMHQTALLHDLDFLVIQKGTVVICSSGIPVWLQDNVGARALRDALSECLGRQVGDGGVPDHESDVQVLSGWGFSVIDTWSM